MNYVGTARPIHDAKGKTTGYTKYAGDLSLPNMAYLCMLHSKIPHGYVKAVHAEKALALPGVYGVYHCLNTTDRKYNRYRSNFDQAYLPNEECAFNDYVRFVGDKIGVVAACDQETAERAARLVEVEYEEPPVFHRLRRYARGQELPGGRNTRPRRIHAGCRREAGQRRGLH